MKYNFKEIEKKWQAVWEETELYKAPEIPGKDKYYMLVMFAYPSGDIHMGHFRNYILGDAIARYQMMLGKDVLHPFGWDAFGLPAERAAIKNNLPPSDWTVKNIEVSRNTLQKTGVSFDWSREIASCLPDYYKWTQWMFIRMFEKGLAYQKTGWINWCPEDKTVLANEQVVNGECERCGTEVEKKELKGWYFKITDYADRLVDGLDQLPKWPDNVKAMQKEWIGRSYGLEVDFTLEESGEKLPIFTTRPDTIYGVTFMAIAPESPLLDKLNLDDEHKAIVEEYKRNALLKNEIDRSSATGEKDGVFTGKYAINPFNGEKVQLWVADYVLAGYGTGAVMAVPAHDSRDFLFAKKYDIPIRIVIHPDNKTSLNLDEMDDAYTNYGVMVNSDLFDGAEGKEAISRVNDYAEEKGIGRKRVNFKLRDWSISRQRYWGCPIPIIHCSKCGQVAVPDDQLPIELPKTDHYIPKGRSPLADIDDYMNVKCPACGGEAERDPDTMDTFVCSSWYFLRYISPKDDNAPFSKEAAKAWMPIDKYIGGISHATGHLIYFRFFQKFLKDIGWLDDEEPNLDLFNHGMVKDAHGEVMSKSKGNVVSPIGLMDDRGIDISRLGMFFTAPADKEVLWSSDVLVGIEKFIKNRFWPMVERYSNSNPDLKCYFNDSELSNAEYDIYIKLNQSIRQIDMNIESMQFNTVISALMELEHHFKAESVTNEEFSDYLILKMIQMIAPLAPHMAEEMWSSCNQPGSVFKSAWPVYDESAVQFNNVTIACQINGKLRSQIEVQLDSDEDTIVDMALKDPKIAKYTDGKTIFKKIYIKNKILNIVVK